MTFFLMVFELTFWNIRPLPLAHSWRISIQNKSFLYGGWTIAEHPPPLRCPRLWMVPVKFEKLFFKIFISMNQIAKTVREVPRFFSLLYSCSNNMKNIDKNYHSSDKSDPWYSVGKYTFCIHDNIMTKFLHKLFRKVLYTCFFSFLLQSNENNH